MKNLWIKYRKPIIYAGLFLIFLLIAFVAGKCSTKKERSVVISNLKASRDSVKQSTVTIDGLKYVVSTKDAIILTKDDALKAQILENARLKALNIKTLVTNTELTGQVIILRDSLKMPNKPIYVTIRDTSGTNHDYIRIPFDLLQTHETYLNLDAGMSENRNAWFKLSVPVSGELSVGYIGTGFLGLKQKPVGVFTSQNPYLTITDMDVLIIKENKKWFQRWWVHALEGALIVEGGRLLLK